MRLTISRESDQFMTAGPTQNWSPHRSASWSEQLKNWVINVAAVEDLVAVGERITVIRKTNQLPHVVINDFMT